MSHSGWGKPGWELRDLAESPGKAWVRLAIPISSMHMPLELPESFVGENPTYRFWMTCSSSPPQKSPWSYYYSFPGKVIAGLSWPSEPEGVQIHLPNSRRISRKLSEEPQKPIFLSFALFIKNVMNIFTGTFFGMFWVNQHENKMTSLPCWNLRLQTTLFLVLKNCSELELPLSALCSHLYNPSLAWSRVSGAFITCIYLFATTIPVLFSTLVLVTVAYLLWKIYLY